MLVRFVTDWFGPNAHLYVKHVPHDVPDEYRDVLPNRATILDAGAHVAPVVADHGSLKDFDELRAAGDAEDAIRSKAEAFRQKRGK